MEVREKALEKGREGKEALFFVCGIKAQSKEVKLILTQRERERWERKKQRESFAVLTGRRGDGFFKWVGSFFISFL